MAAKSKSTEETTEVKKATTKPVKRTLISRANHPITIKYDTQEIVVSPRQRIEIADASKLTVNPQDSKSLRVV